MRLYLCPLFCPAEQPAEPDDAAPEPVEDVAYDEFDALTPEQRGDAPDTSASVDGSQQEPDVERSAEPEDAEKLTPADVLESGHVRTSSWPP